MRALLTLILTIAISYATFGQVKIGDNSSTIGTSSILELESTNKGFVLTRLTTAQKNAIASPIEGMIVYDTDLSCISFYNGTIWSCLTIPSYGLSENTPGESCKDILDSTGASTDGLYWIDPDGSGGNDAFQCYCDMNTDGGGWTLVLNYLHQGGTNPALVYKSTNLPLLGSTTLGGDESASATTWGHANNAMMNSLTFSELRLYAKTSAHSRVIDFKTSHAGTISYFKTGSGSTSGLVSSFTALTGHTANLPTSINNNFSNRGNDAMTDFPFYRGGTYHWGIRGLGSRWEVDDYPNNSSNNTYHQIWIR